MKRDDIEQMIAYTKEYLEEGHTLRMCIGLAYEDTFGYDKPVDNDICDEVRDYFLDM